RFSVAEDRGATQEQIDQLEIDGADRLLEREAGSLGTRGEIDTYGLEGRDSAAIGGDRVVSAAGGVEEPAALPLPPVKGLGRVHALGGQDGFARQRERFAVTALRFVQPAEMAPRVRCRPRVTDRLRDTAGLAQRLGGDEPERIAAIRQQLR